MSRKLTGSDDEAIRCIPSRRETSKFIEQPSVAKQRGAGADVPVRMRSDESRESPRRSRTDVIMCVRGRTQFVEKASADASHKKFSDKKLPESRAKKKNGRARGIQCLRDTKTADIACSSKGRIAELQTALSELAASQVAMTKADWRCALRW